MDPRLRSSAAHVLVDDVAAPALDEATEHHVWRVLRVRDGETVTVTDGRGAWRACRVAGGRSLAPDGDVVTTAPPRRLTVAVAIPKQDRPEWIVQKLTEIGVDRIVLLHAARSVVRWDDERAARNVERLRRVAVEAGMQSRRVWLPEVEGPLPASDVLPVAAVTEPGGRALHADDVVVAVGPEGGWTPDELAMAAAHVTLGETILRVETAALAAGLRLTALRN